MFTFPIISLTWHRNADEEEIENVQQNNGELQSALGKEMYTIWKKYLLEAGSDLFRNIQKKVGKDN